MEGLKMGINGIGMAGYFTKGYTGNNTAKTESRKSFADVVNQKSAEAEKAEKAEKDDRASRVLNSIAEHAPEEVRQAFLEAEKETGGTFTVGGMWVSADGKQSCITQMAVDRIIRWYHGEYNCTDLLGTSVESAVSAVKKWIYGLDHPLGGQPAGMEEKKLMEMERAFYVSFLDKLKKLSDR